MILAMMLPEGQQGFGKWPCCYCVLVTKDEFGKQYYGHCVMACERVTLTYETQCRKPNGSSVCERDETLTGPSEKIKLGKIERWSRYYV